MTDKICAFPWVHMSANTNGEMIICCNTYGRKDQHVVRKNDNTAWNLNEIEDPLVYFNSDYYKKVRLEMLSGKEPEVCKKCYDIERNGGRSIRQNSLNENNINNLIEKTNPNTGELTELTLNYVHFMWGNKCNLKCKMCGPDSSDQLISEFKLMDNRVDLDSKQAMLDAAWDYSNIEETLSLIAPHIRVFNVTGGEPLINNDYLNYCYYLSEMGFSKNVSLAFHTNLTVLPTKFVETWKNFKNVTVKVSIDATGNNYEYVRYPGKWSVIDKNIKRLEEVCNENSKVGVEFHTVFSSFNAHAIADLIKYLSNIKSKQFVNFPNTLQVTNPQYSDSRCIPIETKNQIAAELEALIDNYKDETNQRILNNISNLRSNIKYMLEENIDPNIFFNFNQRQDQFRKIKTEDIIKWKNK